MVIRDETRGAMVGGTGLLMLMIGGSAALLILVPRGDSGVGMTLLFYGIILGMPGLAAYALAMVIRNINKFGRATLRLVNRAPLHLGDTVVGVIEVDRALPNVSGIRLSLACIARSLRPNSPMRETTLWNRTIELGGTDIQIDDRSTMVSFSIALPSPDFKPERSSLLGNIIWRLRAQPLPTTHPNFRYEFLLPAVRTARATFSDHG